MSTKLSTEAENPALNKGAVRRMWRFLKFFWNNLGEPSHREIMIVSYDATLNKIECVDWVSEKINVFCGVFDNDMLQRLKPYCKLGSFPNTRIYIWAGIEKKHLAYGEPIENYLKDVNLWKTGQGFHFGSGKRYGEIEKPKCECCGRHYA